MGLQSKAQACGDPLGVDDTAFPQNLLPSVGGSLHEACTGEVLQQTETGYEVLFGGKTLSARRAVSCLIEPVPADTVALLGTGQGVFITDVLVRSEAAPSGVRINADRGAGPSGDLVISAANLKIEAQESLEATGKSLGFRFNSLLMSGNQLALVGSRLMTSMQEIVANAKNQFASFDTTSTRARNRIDRVTETDQLRAGSIQSQADSVSLTQAGSSLIVAKEDVRMDGKRISMG